MKDLTKFLQDHLRSDGQLLPILFRTLKQLRKEGRWEELLSRELQHKLKVKSEEDKETRAKYLHPSSLSGCELAVIYKFLQAPKLAFVDPAAEFSFEVIVKGGDMIHLLLQTLAKYSPIQCQSELPFRYAPMRMEGHSDQEIDIGEGLEIGEWKSSNEYTHKKMKAAKEEHIEQAHCYYIGRKYGMGADIRRFRFIYVTRDFGNAQEFVVNVDPKILDKLKRKAERIIDCVAESKLIPRPFTDPTSNPCKFCPYMGVCWNPRLKKELKKNLEPGKFKVHEFTPQIIKASEEKEAVRKALVRFRRAGNLKASGTPRNTRAELGSGPSKNNS